MLERREECNAYLTYDCRYHRNVENPVFSPDSLHYDVSTVMSQVGATLFPFLHFLSLLATRTP
jgi:hypothetical protein